MYHLPPPDRLKEEARIQAEVQNRLRQLAENSKPGTEKIKSQRGGAVEVFVNNRVKWPHEFVLSGQNKDRVSSFPPFSGSLASAKLSWRSQMCK